MKNHLLSIDTPCIGICSTVYGDRICIGCKRTYQEIIDWNQYSPTQKKATFDRLNQLLLESIGNQIVVLNQDALILALLQYSVRYQTEADPRCWAYSLLRKKANKISEFVQKGIFGPELNDEVWLKTILQNIDKKFLALSQEIC